MLLQPNRNSAKRLRDVLNMVFKHLDEVAAASIMDVCIWTAKHTFVAKLPQARALSLYALSIYALYTLSLPSG